MSEALELGSGLVATPFAGHRGLAEQAEAWEALATRGDPLCNRFDWARAYARAWIDDQDLFGWRLADEAGPAAVLAFRVEPRAGRFDLGRARLVQDGSFDSDYLDPPVRPGLESAVAEALFRLLATRRALQAAVLGPLDAESRLLPALRTVAQRRGLSPLEEPLACPVAPLPRTYEAYLASLKKRMRSKVRQARRRVEAAGGRYAWCDEAERVEDHLDALFALHASRWGAAGTPGAFADERRRAFYRSLVADHLPAGRLRFSRLELAGRTVACQFGLAVGGRYYQLQEGYAPEHEQLRVGVALRAWTVERLIDEGLAHYDFMAGASQHKADWGGVDRPCVTLACALPKPLGRLAYAARRLRARLRG